MTDLTKTIAELRRDGPEDATWTASLVADGNPYQSSLAGAVATTLNAALSGDLIPKADADLAVALMVEEAATHVRTAEVPREETGEGAMQRALLNYAADVVSLCAPASALAELRALRDERDRLDAVTNTLSEMWEGEKARAEAAEADITTYQKIVADMTQEAESRSAMYATQAEELATLRAQVERLTRALRTIRDDRMTCPRAVDCVQIARAAITEGAAP